MNTKEQFELWAKNQNSDLSIWARGVKSGTYKNPVVGKMWEAWQAASKASEQQLTESRREFTAANATIHNLELKVAQVVAENSSVKAMNDCLSEEMRGYESDGAFEGPKMHLLWWQCETPATDAYLAEVRAQGVDEIAELYFTLAAHEANRSIADSWRESARFARDHAAQLRQGAEK